MASNYRKWVILAALLAVCAWLVRRNLLAPTPAAKSVAAERDAVSRALQTSSPGARPSGRGAARKVEISLDLDPTLRLDLLEASRAV
jgi:hypothetical protein